MELDCTINQHFQVLNSYDICGVACDLHSIPWTISSPISTFFFPHKSILTMGTSRTTQKSERWVVWALLKLFFNCRLITVHEWERQSCDGSWWLALLCDISHHYSTTWKPNFKVKKNSFLICLGLSELLKLKLKLFRKRLEDVNVSHFSSCDLLPMGGSVSVPFSRVRAVEMTNSLTENFQMRWNDKYTLTYLRTPIFLWSQWSSWKTASWIGWTTAWLNFE
jgi:hypothetical protein